MSASLNLLILFSTRVLHSLRPCILFNLRERLSHQSLAPYPHTLGISLLATTSCFVFFFYVCDVSLPDLLWNLFYFDVRFNHVTCRGLRDVPEHKKMFKVCKLWGILLCFFAFQAKECADCVVCVLCLYMFKSMYVCLSLTQINV